LFRDGPDQGNLHANVRTFKKLKKTKKRRITKSPVTPTHNVIERSNFDAVASLAKRIFSLIAIVHKTVQIRGMCTFTHSLTHKTHLVISHNAQNEESQKENDLAAVLDVHEVASFVLWQDFVSVLFGQRV